MNLPDDTSIPFPYDSPETWDQMRLKGLSGETYVWPVNPKHGLVTFKVTPPKIRIKKSVRAGAKKPKVKDVGEDLAKVSMAFECNAIGWPSFVANVLRFFSESIDGPWRLLNPLVETFDARSFKVAAYPIIDDYKGGIVHCTAELLELSPDEQSGLGKNIGTLSAGAKQQSYNTTADAFNAFQLQQAKFIQDQAEYINLARQKDALAKPGVHKLNPLPVKKAIAFGKIEP
jgi:hypothetical protein